MYILIDLSVRGRDSITVVIPNNPCAPLHGGLIHLALTHVLLCMED